MQGSRRSGWLFLTFGIRQTSRAALAELDPRVARVCFMRYYRTMTMELGTRAAPAPGALLEDYDPAHQLPVAGYAALISVWGALMGAVLVTSKPASLHLRTGDTLLVGVATFQLTRIMAKDRVLAPVRAPFTSYQKPAGAGEVEEKARGTGLRKAIGELLTCPYCLAPWVASALAFFLVKAPQKTRWLASVFAAVALADVCQQGYSALKQLSK